MVNNNITERQVDATNYADLREKSKTAIRQIVEKIEVAKENGLKFGVSEIKSLIQDAKDYYKYWYAKQSETFNFVWSAIISVATGILVAHNVPDHFLHLKNVNWERFFDFLVGSFIIYFLVVMKYAWDVRSKCNYVFGLYGEVNNKRELESLKDALFAIFNINRCYQNLRLMVAYLFILQLVSSLAFAFLKKPEVAYFLISLGAGFFWFWNWNSEILVQEERDEGN
jgi:hypothetical protein